MFNVKIDTFNIAFTFSHLRHVGNALGISDVTTCTIQVNGDTFTGVAACSAKDMFCKATGRTVALTRALEVVQTKIELPYLVRKAIWIRYDCRGIPNKDLDQLSLGFSGVLDATYGPKIGSDALENLT